MVVVVLVVALICSRREPGQGTDYDLARRDLKAELLAREQLHFDAVRKEKGKATGKLQDAPALALRDAVRLRLVCVCLVCVPFL